MDLIATWEQDIVPRLDLATIFSALDPHDKGNYLECGCPGCGQHRAWIKKGHTVLICNRRNQCGFAVHVLAYMNGGMFPHGQEWYQLIRDLALRSGVPIDPLKPEDIERFEAAANHSMGLDAVLTWAQIHRGQDMPGVAQNWLLERDLLRVEELGFVSEELINKDAESEPTILHDGWRGRIIGPLKDPYGNLKGLWGRDISGIAKRKYIYTKNAPLKSLFVGLDVVRKEGVKHVTVVEGLIDTFRLHILGDRCVIGLGGVGFPVERWKQLIGFGFESVTLALDTDEAGIQGTHKAILAGWTLEDCPKIEVVDGYFGCKDPDEFTRKHTIEMWFTLPRISAEQFLGRWYLTHYQDTERLLEQAAQFDESITDPVRAVRMERDFWPQILDALEKDNNGALDMLEAIKKKRARMRSKQAMERAMEAAKSAFEEGDSKSSKEHLLNGLAQYTKILSEFQKEAPRLLPEELPQHRAKLRAWKERGSLLGLKSGLGLLDQHLLGLRGLILLAAQTNIGKTILGTQLALGILKNQPDACVLFLSLDMPRDDLITRAECCLARADWKTFVLHTEEEEQVKAERELAKLASNRCMILDERNIDCNTDLVLQYCDQLKRVSGATRTFVIVDYLQVWEVPAEAQHAFYSDNDIDKWRIKQMKALKYALDKHDAILVISEMRKDSLQGNPLSDVMGSARLTYAPDTVLLMEPLTDEEVCAEFQDLGTGYATRTRDTSQMKKEEIKREAKNLRQIWQMSKIGYANLNIAKARDGTTRGVIPLTLFYGQACIEEGRQHYGSATKVETKEDNNNGNGNLDKRADEEEFQEAFDGRVVEARDMEEN